MITSSPSHPFSRSAGPVGPSGGAPPPSSRTRGADDAVAPPRVRELAERGERKPQASWGERLRNVGTLLKDTGAQWSEDEASRLAASLALYTLLSLAPLLVIAVAVAGMVFGEDAARGRISQEIGALVGPQAGQAIEGLVANASAPRSGMVSSLVSIAVVLFGASGVFGELQASLNEIWKVKPRPGRGIRGLVQDRFFSFAMVMGVAFLLLVSLVVSAALAGMSAYFKDVIRFPLLWEAVNLAISLGVTSVLFALIFKLVPDIEIAWRDVWIGGVVTALLFSIGRTALAWYVGRSATVSPFGAAGSLVALIVWVYYSAQILFIGAEFAQAYAARYGTRIVPTRNAVAIDAPEPAKQEADPARLEASAAPRAESRERAPAE